MRQLPLLFLLGCPLSDDDDDDTTPIVDSGTEPCVSTATAVPPGTYGGVHFQLDVATDGSAELLGDCSLATISAVPVADGEVHWTLTWRSGYGLPIQDTATIDYSDVALDGTFCGGTLTGTLTFEDGTGTAISVVEGVQAEIYACE